MTELTPDERQLLRAAEDRFFAAQKDYEPFTVTDPLTEREAPAVRFEEVQKAQAELEESAEALQDLRRKFGLLLP